MYFFVSQMLKSVLIPITNAWRLQMHVFLSDDSLHILYSQLLFHNICSSLPDHFISVGGEMSLSPI